MTTGEGAALLEIAKVNVPETNHVRTSCPFFIEPAVLFLVFGLNLSATVFKNQILYQTCTAVFLYDEQTCALLGSANSTTESKRIETEIQPYAAKILMTKIILESIVPVIGGPFYGAWSDKHGRKPLLTVAYIGYSLIYVITSVICYLSTKFLISPWFYILSVIPESLLGGNCIYRIGIFCYISDISTTKQRPMRMALLEATIYTGLMSGSLAASYVYTATNALVVFTISSWVVVLTTFYVILFVPESLQNTPTVHESPQDVQLNPIYDMLKTCFEQRVHHVRLILWLMIGILFISVFALNGSITVFYLFVRAKFQWTVRDFTLYETLSTFVPILGNIIGMLIMRKIFSVSPVILALIAFASHILCSLARGLASAPWHLYFAIGLGCFKAIGGPMCRAIMSNLVPTTDLGKIFSLLNILESIAPFAAATLYTFIYSQSVAINPGLFNFVTMGLELACFTLMLIIFGIKTSNRAVYGDAI